VEPGRLSGWLEGGLEPVTISSPVGTVHTWRFNTTETLLDGSPISGGPFTSWTVPFHDGDVAVSCRGAGGGSDSLVWYRGGNGGGIGGDAAIAAGTVLDVFPGTCGTRPSGGTAGGGMFTGGDAVDGRRGGGGAPSAVLTPSGLLIIAGGGGGGSARILLLPPVYAGSGGYGHAAGSDDTLGGGKGGTLSAGGAGHGGGAAGTAGHGGAAIHEGGGGGGGYYGGGGGGNYAGGGGGSSWAHASITGVGSNVGVPRDTDGYITITLDYLGDWVEPSTGGWSVGMIQW